MENQVTELIVYKVKEEFANDFVPEIIPKFRELIGSFGGLVLFQTFRSTKAENQYFDQVVWESQEHALDAIRQFEEMKKNGQYLELMNWFEEVSFMDHFKLVA